MDRGYDQVVASGTEPTVEVGDGKLADEISRQINLLNEPPELESSSALRLISMWPLGKSLIG